MKKWQIANVESVKQSTWDEILSNFNEVTGFVGLVTVSNLKSKIEDLITNYTNLSDVMESLNEEDVMKKCEGLSQKLLQLLVSGEAKVVKPEIFTSIDSEKKLYQQVQVSSDKVLEQTEEISFKSPISRLNKLRNQRDFIYGSAPNSSMYTIKKLENQLKLEMLTFEKEKWKIKAENQTLLKQKLQKKNTLAATNLEKAQIELELLKSGSYIGTE